jgi:endonuclease YncB( thermonuclease family)
MSRPIIRFVLVGCLISASSPYAYEGVVRVIDGDTIDLTGKRVRLHGIDTPESKQTCQREGVSWLCGAEATKTLKELIDGSEVTCAERDKDRYGRIVAVCHANGRDLNAAMVLSGMALAYRKYSNDYTDHEASAKAARRGLWAGQFVPPWDWRRGKRLVSNATAANGTPDACQIKGNIGSKGDRVYHMPSGRWYDRTVITASKGERWFCSEEQARGAGWRRAGAKAFTMPGSGRTPSTTEPVKACCKVCRMRTAVTNWSTVAAGFSQLRAG